MSEGCGLSIGLVGYGEVGKILTAALVGREVAWVGAWTSCSPIPRPPRR